MFTKPILSALAGLRKLKGAACQANGENLDFSSNAMFMRIQVDGLDAHGALPLEGVYVVQKPLKVKDKLDTGDLEEALQQLPADQQTGPMCPDIEPLLAGEGPQFHVSVEALDLLVATLKRLKHKTVHVQFKEGPEELVRAKTPDGKFAAVLGPVIETPPAEKR